MRVVGPAVLVAIAGAGVTLGAPRLKEVRKPVDPPAGEWWVEKWERDGDDLEVNRNRVGKLAKFGWTVTLTKDKVVVNMGGQPVSGGRRVAYYQTGTVLGFDLFPDLHAADPKAGTKGIWKVDGDTLLFCYGEPGGDRPTEFAAPRDSGRTLWTLKRKGKD